jgi:integrase
LLAVHTQAGPAEIPRERDAEALLGGATKPTIPVSDAFEVYLSEIAYNTQLYKSPNQRASWGKTKRTSIQYVIDFAGDMALEEITRDLALKYQQHWARQVKPKDGKVTPVAPNRGQSPHRKHPLALRRLFQTCRRGRAAQSIPQHAFQGKGAHRSATYSSEWVRTKVLAPGATRKWCRQLQLITMMLIETGCRPSEIINLRVEDFHIEEPVPYISIRARTDREVKTDTSERDIPWLASPLRRPDGPPLAPSRTIMTRANSSLPT